MTFDNVTQPTSTLDTDRVFLESSGVFTAPSDGLYGFFFRSHVGKGKFERGCFTIATV